MRCRTYFSTVSFTSGSRDFAVENANSQYALLTPSFVKAPFKLFRSFFPMFSCPYLYSMAMFEYRRVYRGG
jgi:hypothetical protein